MPRKGHIIVVSAPSGAGKTTLLRYLHRRMPDLHYSISATTRPPRKNEIPGEDYYFMDKLEFSQKAEQGEFAEWQKVHDNYYGSPREPIDRAVSEGWTVVMDIDVQGKLQLDTVYPDAVGILILPPSMEALETRLRRRGTDSEYVIKRRLENASAEITVAETQGKYEYTILNDDLEKAKQEIVQLVEKIVHGEEK